MTAHARPLPYAQPNRGHPLWTACIFAHAVGAYRGIRPNDLLSVSREDVHGTRFEIIDSLEADIWGVTSHLGLDLRQTPAGSINRYDYGNQGDRFHPRFGRMSIAVLVRPLTIPATATAQGILSKASTPGSTTQTEYDMGINGTASTWRYYVTPPVGATNLVNSITTLSLARTDMLIGTYTENNMRIYVNGIKEADIVPANTGIKNISGENLGWFLMKGGTGSVFADAAMGMGAVWERELTHSEIMELSADPYTMWRSQRRVYGNAAAAPPEPGDADNSCCCCPGVHMNGPFGAQQIIY